jgi:hypothetical protein
MTIINEQERSRMVEMFGAGEPLGRIGRTLGRSTSSVRRQLLISGVLTGYAPLHREGYRSRRGHTINEHAFDVASPERDYWVGMLMTDGCVSDGSVILSLGDRDVDHVYAFRQFLGATHRIRVKPTNGSGTFMADFRVKSDRLSNVLSSFGVVPRKTRVAKVIGLESSRDFWRGCIDGDGSVCLVKAVEGTAYGVYPVIALCGASLALLEQFASYIRSVIPSARMGVKKPQIKNGLIRGKTFTVNLPVSQVSLKGQHAIQMIRHLYSGARVSLTRKADTAEKIMQMADSNPTWCVHPRRGAPGKRTPEQCARIGAAKLGVKQTPDHIASRTRGMLNSDRVKESAKRRAARQHEARAEWIRQNTPTMIALASEGFGVVKIAERLRCDTDFVSKALRENGVVVKSGPRPDLDVVRLRNALRAVREILATLNPNDCLDGHDRAIAIIDEAL